MSTKCWSQLPVNVKILTIFCTVSSDWTTRGLSDLLQNWTHQLTRNIICFYYFYFIMQGKLIILRTTYFLHQNTSQLQWFKEKTLLQSKFCCKLKSSISKVSKRGEHSVVRLKKKAWRNSDHPNTKISHRLRNDNVLVLVRGWHLLQTRKITNPFTTIMMMQKNQPRTQNTVSILFNGCP